DAVELERARAQGDAWNGARLSPGALASLARCRSRWTPRPHWTRSRPFRRATGRLRRRDGRQPADARGRGRGCGGDGRLPAVPEHQHRAHFSGKMYDSLRPKIAAAFDAIKAEWRRLTAEKGIDALDAE